MQYRKKDYDSSTELFLEDKLLSHDSDIFNSIIEEFTNSPQTNLIINLENTAVLDTGGLGSLLLGLQKITDANKKLVLKNPKDDVKAALSMLNFETLFDIDYAD